jgi:cytochrome c peroxidase
MHSRSWPVIAAVTVALPLAACTDLTSSSDRTALAAPTAVTSKTPAPTGPLPQLVRQLAASRGVVPLPPKPNVRPALAHLGQALMFDKELSGNRDIACATCHLPSQATGDGRALSIGQGATGIGPARVHPNGDFIARNAPPLFNLAAMRHLFWDGRVEADAYGKLTTPAGAQITPDMTKVFEFGPVSALAMFPVTSRAEMRSGTSNDLGAIDDSDFRGIWAAEMRRLGAIPEYRGLFQAAYPGTNFDDMTFAHASNAIAGFIVDRFTFADSPWDRFLAGNDAALTMRQLEGAQTFLTLKCSICHTGATFSDDDFHNVAVPQIGPGQGDGLTTKDDFGRMRVTGLASDLYRFRTTPLRNVELTGPYGHDGAIGGLRDFVEHYSESDLKLLAFDPSKLEPLLRLTMVSNHADVLVQRDTLLAGVVLTPELTDKLMDYMTALTDDAARDLSRTVPVRVPSRMIVDSR